MKLHFYCQKPALHKYSFPAETKSRWLIGSNDSNKSVSTNALNNKSVISFKNLVSIITVYLVFKKYKSFALNKNTNCEVRLTLALRWFEYAKGK